MSIKTAIFVVIPIIVVAALAGTADAKHRRFRSRHPMPPHVGGFCNIEVAHHHPFGPHDVRLYRVVGGDYYFVGDPVPYGYQGPRHAYFDPHPVVEASVQFGEPAWCYLDGPHYHWYQPQAQAQAQFAVSNGAFFFTGTFDPFFHRHRPRYVSINHVYRPIHYARPVVDISVAPAGWRRHTVVHAPARAVVVARPPSPVINVGVGVGVRAEPRRSGGWRDGDGDHGRRGGGNDDRGHHGRGKHKGKHKD